MIDALKPYAEYKEVGLPWLGKIPKHWEVRRGKSVFKCIDVRSKAGKEELLTVSSKDGVVPRREKNVTMFMAESYEGYKLCWPGDLVINSLWAWAGGLGFSRHHGIISSAYGVYRPNEEFSDHWKYFDYLLRSIVYDWEFHVRSKGIWVSRLQLTDPSFFDMPIVLPPNSEAVAIAQFLTGASARISRLIRDKWRLIELLNEQKKAIIHHAVTHGIDPNVLLKPSGVEWLGDVPAHWEVTKLKHVAKVQTGITLGKNYGSVALESHPYLRVANVQDGFLDLKEINTVSVPISEALACELQPGDVLMTEGGDIDKLGRGYIWRGEIPHCIHQNHVFAVRCNHNKLIPEFLSFLMTSSHGRHYFQLTAKQTTNLASTNSTTLKTFPLVLPSVTEQRSMLAHLGREFSPLELAIERAEKEIALIREYRTRLISDVVTGKLDVRGVKLPAMDEAEGREDIEIGEETEAEEHIESEEVADADE